jgi:hypothetical protein
LIMLGVVVGVLEDIGVKFDVLVDGDNALIFLSRPDLSRVVGEFAPRVLEATGHEVVLERPVDYIEGIRFGGSAPVYLGPRLGWSMVREWGRVLSCAYASHRWLREPVFAREWIRGVTMCELSLARGVPVLQAWALGGLKATEDVVRVRSHPHVDYFVQGAWLAGEQSSVPVTLQARISFARAFGVEPEAQVVLEDKLRRLQLGKLERSAYQYHGSDNYAHWREEPGIHERWMDAHC